MSLVALVSRELDGLISDCEGTYRQLDKLLVGSREQIKRSQRTIKETNDRIQRARSEYNKFAARQNNELSLDNLLLLQNTIDSLERGLPSQETTQQIVETLSVSLDRSEIGLIYDKIREGIPFSVQLNVLSALAAFYLESPISGSIFAAAGAAGMWEMFSQRESSRRVFWTNQGNLFGAAALSSSYADPNLVPSDRQLVMITVLSDFVLTMYQRHLTRGYRFKKREYDAKADFVKNARIDFDNFMRSGAVIPEAIENLRYLKNECSGIITPNLDRQLREFELAAVGYFSGNNTFDEVSSARIKRKLRSSEKRRLRALSEPRPVSSGNKRIEKPKEEDRPRQYRPNPIAEPEVERPVIFYEQVPQISVKFSPDLSSLYTTRQLIGGYTVGPLMDLTRVKIEKNPQGEVIRESTNGINLANRIKERHGLPDAVTIFKMRPIGSLRALYIRQNNEIKVLEILTHTQYDRMMN